MPSEFEPGETDDDLQFATAEPADAGTAAVVPAQVCALCRRPIVSSYFAIRDKILCRACCEVVTAPPAGSAAGRFFKACAMGLGAGLFGALIWFAIRRVTHYEIGLVAVAVGFMVGKAVRKGSGGRGGRGYQILAVLLTYSCIAANYMPDVFEGLMEARTAHHTSLNPTPNSGSKSGGIFSNLSQKPLPVQIVVGLLALAALALLVFFAAAAAPFISISHNPIQLLIIGFALWEAWKFTRKAVLPITGPYQIGPRGSAAPGGPSRVPVVGA